MFTYDANGNVTSITPPSRPAHSLGKGTKSDEKRRKGRKGDEKGTDLFN